MPHNARNLRVAILTGANLSKGAVGGTGVYVTGLIRYLTGHGIGVDVMSNGDVEDPPPTCSIHPITDRHLTSTSQFRRILKSQALNDVLCEATVLHLQRPDDLPYVQLGSASPALLCTLHGDAWKSIHRRHGALALLRYRQLESRALRRLRAVIAVDRRTAEAYASRYPSLQDRLMMIPPAVEVPGTEPGKSPQGVAQSDGLTILYAGRLSREKRVDKIIQTFVASPNLENARLIIVGSGPEESRLRMLARNPRIEFRGVVPHDKMVDLYQAADTLVLASEYEGTPTVALEALASSCPVVALPSCGVDPSMSNGGVFISPSLDALPANLEAAARRRRNAPPIKLASRYTWSEVGERLVALYTRLATEAVA